MNTQYEYNKFVQENMKRTHNTKQIKQDRKVHNIGWFGCWAQISSGLLIKPRRSLWDPRLLLMNFEKSQENRRKS